MNWKQREILLDRYIFKEDGCTWRLKGVQDTEDKYNKDSFTVQYTGVKDVNGKKIFEGDIVNISNKLCSPSTPDWVGYVKYDTNSGAFIISVREDKDYVTHVLIISPASEIIGNVFQNPELVEKYKLEI